MQIYAVVHLPLSCAMDTSELSFMFSGLAVEDEELDDPDIDDTMLGLRDMDSDSDFDNLVYSELYPLSEDYRDEILSPVNAEDTRHTPVGSRDSVMGDESASVTHGSDDHPPRSSADSPQPQLPDTTDGSSTPDTRTRSSSGTSASSHQSPYQQRTKNYRAYHQEHGTLCEAIRSVLGCMRSNHIDLPLLLWGLSYNVPELVTDELSKYERIALLSSDELPGFLKIWSKPPRTHGLGTRSKGAAEAVDAFVFDHVGRVMDREMATVGEYMRTSVDTLSEDELLGIKISDVKEEVKKRAPRTWALLLRCAWTSRQAKENTLKDPETVSRVLANAT